MAVKKKTRRKFTYAFLLIILLMIISFSLDKLYDTNFEVKDNEEEYSDDNLEQVYKEKVDISIGLVDIDTFNPILTQNIDVINFNKLIYNSLFDYDKDMQLVMQLVDSFNCNDNNIYIKLQKGIKWHDGTELTAYDVDFTIRMIKEYKGIYYDFVKNILQVEVIDNYTLNIVVADKGVLTQYDLTFPIISSRYYENEDFKKTDKNMMPMGTGMYRYVYTNDKYYNFTCNNKYGKSHIENIYVYNYTSISEAFANVKNKKVDMIFTSLTNYDDYIGKIGYLKEEYIDNTYVFLAVNIGNKYLNNVNVRKAINISIDKEAIFSQVYNGIGYVSQSLLYPQSYLYKNIDENYDIDQAKQILIDNKLINEISLNLLVNNNDDDIKVADLIKSQLEKINIKVDVVVKSKKDYNEALKNNMYDLALVNFNITSNINMNMFEDNQFYSVFNFENVEFKNYIANIKNLNTYDERKESFDKMQELILDYIPYIGIGFKVNSIIYSPDLLGVTDARYNNLFHNISEFYKK